MKPTALSYVVAAAAALLKLLYSPFRIVVNGVSQRTEHAFLFLPPKGGAVESSIRWDLDRGPYTETWHIGVELAADLLVVEVLVAALLGFLVAYGVEYLLKNRPDLVGRV